MKKHIDGIVKWFDNDNGQITDIETKLDYYVHYSAIKSNDVFKVLKKGKTCRFTLYTNLYMSQVDSVIVDSE